MQQFIEIVEQTTRGMIERGEMRKLVEARVQATVSSIVENAFSAYSPFGKALSEAIQASLSIDPSALGLLGYNQTVLAVVKQTLDRAVECAAREKLAKDMEALLGVDAPKEKKLSELVLEFKKSIRDWERKDSRRCTVIFEAPGPDNSFSHLYLGKKADQDKYRCDYSLGFTGQGEMYTCRIEGRDPKQSLFLGKLYDFERTVFQLYAAGTRIVIDQKEFDDELEAAEEDDRD